MKIDINEIFPGPAMTLPNSKTIIQEPLKPDLMKMVLITGICVAAGFYIYNTFIKEQLES